MPGADQVHSVEPGVSVSGSDSPVSTTQALTHPTCGRDEGKVNLFSDALP